LHYQRSRSPRRLTTFDQILLAEAMPKSRNKSRIIVFGAGAEKSDHGQSWLPRPRRHRPCRRAAEKRDEFAAPDHLLAHAD